MGTAIDFLAAHLGGYLLASFVSAGVLAVILFLLSRGIYPFGRRLF